MRVELTQPQILVLLAAAAQVEPEWEDAAEEHGGLGAQARRDLRTLDRACKRLANTLPPARDAAAEVDR